METAITWRNTAAGPNATTFGNRRRGPEIQAVRDLNTHAIQDATKADHDRAKNGKTGPLYGIPVLLDDSFDVKGLPTTGGSIALQHSSPNDNSTVVAKLEADTGRLVRGLGGRDRVGPRGDDRRPGDVDRHRTADCPGRRQRRRRPQADRRVGQPYRRASGREVA